MILKIYPYDVPLRMPIILLCCIFLCTISIAQEEANPQIDSLYKLITQEKIDSVKFDLYDDIIDILFDGDKASTIAPFKEQLSIANSLKDSTKIAKVMSSLGGVYMSLGQSAEAYDYLHQSHAIFAQQGNATEVSYLLNDIALLHQRENRYEEAIQAYQQLIILSDSLNDYIGEMIADINLMSLFMDIDDPIKGLEYGNNALHIKDKIPSNQNEDLTAYNSYLSAIYLNMGLCFCENEHYNPDSALLYLDKAYESLDFIEDEYSTTYYKGYIDNSKGDIYYEISQKNEVPESQTSLINSALTAYKDANKSFIEVSDSRGQSMSYNNIGKTLNKLSRYQLAKESLDKGLQLATDLNFQEEIRDSYEALAENAENLKDYKKSNEYLKLFIDFRDKIINEDREKITRGYEVRYQTMNTQNELEDKKRETEIANKTKTIQLYIFALSLLAICVVAYMIYSRLRFNKQKDIANYERSINATMSKFVPMGFLKALGYDKITDVSLGDQTEIEVTVLFTDIRSFTTISEAMTPNENFEFVREYARRMGPIIEANNGFISQYLGDGIMAIFQNSPTDALVACIQMQNAIVEYNKELQKRNVAPIKVGMGMHTGPLIMGIIGDDTRWDATLISDTVNTAARIERTTKQFESDILLSEDSATKIQETNSFRLNQLGEVLVKGKIKPVGIFECVIDSTEIEKTLENLNQLS